ncbi:FadR/GntR family transcriptional regulator [Streptomyces sp. NPDC048720]|uniref:FadR/GntR family transcriptional regulator n=1 Tax=Streptomyces sp. NPDC048720 TaxID=3365588 RepID=UPI00371539C5
MEALPRETIVDVLEGRLREDILAGRHPAGSYLPPERTLADGYGVTRITLKHAFGRLTQAGLLEARHSPDWIGEVCEVRCHIGTLIAGRAAARATERQRDQLRALLSAVGDASDALPSSSRTSRSTGPRRGPPATACTSC